MGRKIHAISECSRVRNCSKCLTSLDRDEWPPFAFQYNPATQLIRFLSQYQNKAAGQLWRQLCTTPAARTTTTETGITYEGICYQTEHVTYTINAMTMRYINMPSLFDYGLAENSCVPWTLTTDSGYALLTDDWYYAYSASPDDFRNRGNYQYPPPSSLTQGKSQPRLFPAKKRWLHEPFEDYVDVNDIIVDEGNTTRRATDEELLETHGVLRCVSDNCKAELNALGVTEDELQKLQQRETSPATAIAHVTQTSAALATAATAPSVATPTSHLDPAVADNTNSRFLGPTLAPESGKLYKGSRWG
jgi:chitinase